MLVRKLVSLNPDEYEDVELEDALFNYEVYIHTFTLQYMRDSLKNSEINPGDPKSFKMWLETEI